MVLLLTLTALVLLPALYLRDAGRERRQRDGWFADTLALFGNYRVTRSGAQFPVLEGRYRGFEVRLEPVLDNMAWRKIPSLWLKATVLSAHPARGTLDFLVRPEGMEFYSPSNDLAVRLPVPKGWPVHAILCTDDASALPDIATLTPHMAAFDDPKTKELLITARGVRLVYQAAQAERAEYLVLRQARFAQTRLDPRLVRELLDRAIAIAAALDAAALDHDSPKAEAA